jgi:hypothetical protein
MFCLGRFAVGMVVWSCVTELSSSPQRADDWTEGGKRLCSGRRTTVRITEKLFGFDFSNDETQARSRFARPLATNNCVF